MSIATTTARETDHGQSESDIRMVRKWAGLYRERGYNPLPTRPDRNRPFIRYAGYWEEPYPAGEFEKFAARSLQVMTGRRWGLVVIDLDGPEAIAHWEATAPAPPRTWVTHSGGGGRHLWFSVPTSGPPIRSGRAWGVWEPEANGGRGDWRKHVAIEILGDRKLVVAPPSIHPKTGNRYRFFSGHSPRDVARPAPAPAWLLAMPRLAAPAIAPSRPRISIPARVGPAPAGRWDARAVKAAVRDKAAVAAAAGLRIASGVNGSGWMSCHSVHREDRVPSASFNPDGGVYWDATEGSLGFFDLLVTLGAYADWRDAVADLGTRYGVPPLP